MVKIINKINNSNNYLKDVRTQYSTRVYPPRNVDDEMFLCVNTSLEVLNDSCFAGKRHFKNFRVLDAGCGCGDDVIFMSKQLKELGGSVVGLDFSKSSLDIAKQRLERFGIDNATLIHGSLLDLPTMGLGKFDFVVSAGVLHHLKDPEAGLNALKSVLKPNGVINIMVYGKIGRTGVYQVQELMKLINTNCNEDQEKVENTKIVLRYMHNDNWFSHQKDWFIDHKPLKKGGFGDNGIYDLFLNSQDRAYSVPDLYEFAENCGLKLYKFAESHRYDPSSYIKDKNLLKLVEELPVRKQQYIAELLSGNLTKHSVFLVRKEEQEYFKKAELTNFDNVLVSLQGTDPTKWKLFFERAKKEKLKVLQNNFDKSGIEIKINKYMEYILTLADGKRTLGEICKIVQKKINKQKITNEYIINRFSDCYNKLNSTNCIVLRHKNTPAFFLEKFAKPSKNSANA